VLLNVADRCFRSVHVTEHYCGDQNDTNVVVGNVTLGGGRWRSGVWQGNIREEDNFEDLGVDGRIITIDLEEIRWGRVD
jgi:hypothetical protein